MVKNKYGTIKNCLFICVVNEVSFAHKGCIYLIEIQ